MNRPLAASALNIMNTPSDTRPFPPIHRVVTGHDQRGQAIISSQGPLPTVVAIEAIPGTVFHEVWSTEATPVRVDNGPDPTLGPLRLPPPAGGTRLRFVDIPPDTAEYLATGAGRMKEAFTQIGDAAASTVAPDSPHPLMHRTESVDYAIMLEGELVAIMDTGETVLRAGDVLIQRGTRHAWANRSGKPARIAFVLIAAGGSWQAAGNAG